MTTCVPGSSDDPPAERVFEASRELYYDKRYGSYYKLLPVFWLAILFGISFRVKVLDNWGLYSLLLYAYSIQIVRRSRSAWEKVRPTLTLHDNFLSIGDKLPRNIPWSDIDHARIKRTVRYLSLRFKSAPWKDAIIIYRCYPEAAFTLLEDGLAGRPLIFADNVVSAGPHLSPPVNPDEYAHTIQAIGLFMAAYGLIMTAMTVIVAIKNVDPAMHLYYITIIAAFASCVSFISIQLMRMKESGRIAFIIISNVFIAFEIRRHGLLETDVLIDGMFVTIFSLFLCRKNTIRVIDGESYNKPKYSIINTPSWAWFLIAVILIYSSINMFRYVMMG